MMSGENPYQAPDDVSSTGLPEAPSSFGWEVIGGAVQVEKLSQLPMVDPFTGRTADTMLLQRVEVRYRPTWLLASIPFCIMALIFVFRGSGSREAVMAITFLGLLLGWLAYRFLGLFFPMATLHLFFEKRTIRFRKWQGRIFGILFLLFIPGGFFMSMGPAWLQKIPLISGLIWLVGTLVISIFQRRLRCSRRVGDAYIIKGFHPAALNELGARNSFRHDSHGTAAE